MGVAGGRGDHLEDPPTRPACIVPWLAIGASFWFWWAIRGWAVASGWWLLTAILAVDAVVAVLEIATLRRWSGFWGEKNPDGTPKW